MGPWYVTRDEIPDPGDLAIECRVNGAVRQRSRTSNLVFSVPFLLAYVSVGITLEPGDILTTGTPGGVGLYRDPPEYLKPGDRVEVEIERIGVLANVVA